LGSSESPADYGEGLYRPDLRGEVYDELLRRAGDALRDRRSVVIDGAFMHRRVRRQAYELAAGRTAVPLFVMCHCPRTVALARIEKRTGGGCSHSEARPELYDRQAQEFEPPDSNDTVLRVDTTRPLSEQTQAVCQELRRRLFE
jgi:predicted kinase